MTALLKCHLSFKDICWCFLDTLHPVWPLSRFDLGEWQGGFCTESTVCSAHQHLPLTPPPFPPYSLAERPRLQWAYCVLFIVVTLLILYDVMILTVSECVLCLSFSIFQLCSLGLTLPSLEPPCQSDCSGQCIGMQWDMLIVSQLLN